MLRQIILFFEKKTTNLIYPDGKVFGKELKLITKGGLLTCKFSNNPSLIVSKLSHK